MTPTRGTLVAQDFYSLPPRDRTKVRLALMIDEALDDLADEMADDRVCDDAGGS